MKILVTGGAGFIGSALIRELLRQTGHSVINVDCLTYAGNLQSLAAVAAEPSGRAERYRFVKADIRDAQTMARILVEHRPDAIMNLAAESHVDRSIEGPKAFVDTNIGGTLTLLEAARAYWQTLEPGARERFRFHQVSTDEVYGDLGSDDAPFKETTPYAPSSPYAASKAGADHLVRAWHRTYGLPVLVTSCSNNYGPYQFPEKLIPHMILSALAGKRLPIYGDGRQIRDWLFVEDHARALIRVLEGGRVGETYNIGGNSEERNITVVEAVCDLLERHAAALKPEGIAHYRDLVTFVPDRPGHDRRYAIDAAKLAGELGWQPRESFASGLEATVVWYLENQSWWQRVLDGSYRLERRGL